MSTNTQTTTASVKESPPREPPKTPKEIIDAFVMFRREIALIRATQLKAHDLGHLQAAILYRLSTANATMGELSEYAMADKASTTRVIASLESSGFVKRLSAESDKRISIVELTAKGRTKAAKAISMRNALSEMVDKTLTTKDRKELIQLLLKVTSGLQEQRNGNEE